MNRTDTTSRLEFTLPSPNGAHFDFSRSFIQITIPAGSTWHMPLHWHERRLDTQWIGVEAGRLHIYSVNKAGTSGDFFTGASNTEGTYFKLDDIVAWENDNQDADRIATLPLTVNIIADPAFHRNICSAILDHDDVFPRLSSTPLWLKVLFAMPMFRRRLLEWTLRVQLQAIYWKHDFRLDYGCIPFTYPWVMWPFGRAPDWAQIAERRSQRWISSIVMSSAYWSGRLFLGMKGEYARYTPLEEPYLKGHFGGVGLVR